MALAVLLCTSCLESNDDEITYYDDTAITSFSLGTLKQYITTTASDGSDSTYSTSFTASSYVFYIDQLNATIYNPDSLPVGIDAEHILCYIGTKNSGTAILELKAQDGSDSLAYYSSSDSIDFSSPVHVRVYNTTGTSYRTYTVHVNIHQQTGDELSWDSQTVDGLSNVGGRKLVANGDQMYLFGAQGSQSVGYSLVGSEWQQLATSGTTLSADAYKSVVSMGGNLYTLSDGTVMSSTDGVNWQTMASASELTQIVGASNSRLYALGTSGLYASTDQGATWTVEELDDSASLLPDEDVNFICKPHTVNENTYKLILIGNRDGNALVWSKVEEDDEDAQSQPWSYYTPGDNNRYPLSYLSNLQVIKYGDELLAQGGDFSTWYASQDEGLTWLSDSLYTLTSDFGLEEQPFSMACSSTNYIYLTKQGSSVVWSGQLASMGWATEKKSYTE